MIEHLNKGHGSSSTCEWPIPALVKVAGAMIGRGEMRIAYHPSYALMMSEAALKGGSYHSGVARMANSEAHLVSDLKVE